MTPTRRRELEKKIDEVMNSSIGKARSFNRLTAIRYLKKQRERAMDFVLINEAPRELPR